LLLRYDIGFQLSFLAVLGLIYIKPIFDEKWRTWLKKEKISPVLEIIDTTIAAQVSVLPILVYNFGNISFVAPITNVLIVPFIQFFTILGLIFIGGTAIWLFIGKILVWPIYLGSLYILKIIDWFSQIPWASKQISNLHWIWIIVYYVLLIGLLCIYKRKNKLEF
jgi:competence protein ComEC